MKFHVTSKKKWVSEETFLATLRSTVIFWKGSLCYLSGMIARKQSQCTLFDLIGKYVIALSLAGISSLQAQTNYYLDYSHNVVMTSPRVWSGSDLNISVDNGSIGTPIDQSLHVVPSADGDTISLTFPTTVPDNTFFQLEQSTLMRP